MRAFNGTARVLVDPWYKWWQSQRGWEHVTDALSYWLPRSITWSVANGTSVATPVDLRREDDDAPGKPPF